MHCYKDLISTRPSSFIHRLPSDYQKGNLTLAICIKIKKKAKKNRHSFLCDLQREDHIHRTNETISAAKERSARNGGKRAQKKIDSKALSAEERVQNVWRPSGIAIRDQRLTPRAKFYSARPRECSGCHTPVISYSTLARETIGHSAKGST